MAMTTTDFEAPATEAELEALAGKLRERNFEVVIVENAAEAIRASPRPSRTPAFSRS
jgi:hypothetical protein